MVFTHTTKAGNIVNLIDLHDVQAISAKKKGGETNFQTSFKISSGQTIYMNLTIDEFAKLEHLYKTEKGGIVERIHTESRPRPLEPLNETGSIENEQPILRDEEE